MLPDGIVYGLESTLTFCVKNGEKQENQAEHHEGENSAITPTAIR